MQEVAQYGGDADVASSSTETEHHPERICILIMEAAISWSSRSE